MDDITASVADRLNNPGLPAIIIGEIGSNFGGTLDSARAMIWMVAEAGCDFAKFQISKPICWSKWALTHIWCWLPSNCHATGSPRW